MAMNPMQRKIRNSFLLGFLIAIIVGAVVIGLLFMKIKGLKEEMVEMQTKEKLATTEVYTVAEKVENGENIKELKTVIVPTNQVPENAITAENLDDYAEKGQEDEYVEDENGNISYQMVAKVDITPNTLLTTDLVEKSAKAGTYRLVEYSMFSLPSKLNAGDYIDIRMAYPTSADFIVLSKMEVQEATTNSIWLKVSESQLLLLNNAIVESYIIEGTKLYVTQYSNAAQASLNTTYVPNETVASLIENNSLTDADKEILDKARNDDMEVRKYIASVLNNYSADEQVGKVAAGFTAEKASVQAAREALLGELGY